MPSVEFNPELTVILVVNVEGKTLSQLRNECGEYEKKIQRYYAGKNVIIAHHNFNNESEKIYKEMCDSDVLKTSSFIKDAVAVMFGDDLDYKNNALTSDYRKYILSHNGIVLNEVPIPVEEYTPENVSTDKIPVENSEDVPSVEDESTSEKNGE